MAKRKVKDIKPCEHVNVDGNEVEGVPVYVCRDCHSTVDAASMTPEVVAEDPLTAFAKKNKSIVKAVEYKVGDVVKLPQLPEAFFPVFGAREGDVLVIYRPNG